MAIQEKEGGKVGAAERRIAALVVQYDVESTQDVVFLLNDGIFARLNG